MITEEITKDITDRKWRHLKWTECAGLGWWENMAKVIFPEGIEAKLRTLTALDIRDDDVMICTFPKAGLSGEFIMKLRYSLLSKQTLHFLFCLTWETAIACSKFR